MAPKQPDVDVQTGPAIPETHGTLYAEPWAEDSVIGDALKESNAELQRLSDADGGTYHDEYSVTVETMPPGVTPEAFLGEMMRDMNGTANNSTFDTLNKFERREPNEPPHKGEIVDIGFPLGPNGSVMLTDITSSSFTYSTITNKDKYLWLDDSHPINGSREFGFERNADGSITFYTRSTTKPHDLMGQLGEDWGIQRKSWESLMDGLSNNVESRGGTVRPNSREGYRWHEVGLDPRGRPDTSEIILASFAQRNYPAEALAMTRVSEAFARLQSLL